MQTPSRISFLTLSLAALALAGYWVDKLWISPSAAGSLQMPPVKVCVVETKPADLPIILEYAGRTAGSKQVDIYARATGLLQERTYKEGAYVHEGDLLFKIEPTQLESALAEAQATLMQAESNWIRSRLLYDQKALSSSQYEQALATVEAARAQVRAKQSDFSYTTVVAPLSGMTSQENLSEGNLVMAGETLLTRITKLDPLYIYFDYPDKDYTQLRRDMASGKISFAKDETLTVKLKLSDDLALNTLGVVDFTDSFIDPKTSSVHARASVPNPDEAVLAGEFVRINIQGLIQKNALAIPEQAIVQSPQGMFVYIVDSSGNAQVRPVTLGSLVGSSRIIESGLDGGESVIFEGMIKVRPGQPVSVVPWSNPHPASLKP